MKNFSPLYSFFSVAAFLRHSLAGNVPHVRDDFQSFQFQLAECVSFRKSNRRCGQAFPPVAVIDEVPYFPDMPALLVHLNTYATHEPVSHDDGEVELNTFAPFFRVESQKFLLLFNALGLCREIDELRVQKDFDELPGVGYRCGLI